MIWRGQENNMSKNFYITTTLPYVNSDPHIGFALEIVRADAIARYKKICGFDVFFNTGTDEHGQKIFNKAKENEVEVKNYVDGYASKFKEILPLLNISSDINFIRTTDDNHIKSAQAFWLKCYEAGDIYKKEYKVKYCVGCELEKTDSELENDKCPLHPNQDIQLIEEENYFFRFSKYQKALLDLYTNNPNFVLPQSRQNEIKAFVERGLSDFSISRLKSKMSWGVPVPNDPDHVMYVWFDALVNYISAIGWPYDMDKFNKWWPVVQYAGKDNLRQQSAMWQAMLMSVGLSPSKQIVINGFITGPGGKKMSKSLGNVVNPIDIVSEYGGDTLRFYLLKEVNSFEDSPFSKELLEESYNTYLVNGIGNLTSRIMKMAETYLTKPVFESGTKFEFNDSLIHDAIEKFDLRLAMDLITEKVKRLDEIIQNKEPFKVVKVDREEGQKIIIDLVKELCLISIALEPFLPNTSQKIQKLITDNKMPQEPLFPRKK